MITKETDIQAALSDFYCRCPFTKIDVQDEYINYKIGIWKESHDIALDESNRIISENNLPLKAEIIGYPFKNILQITAK